MLLPESSSWLTAMWTTCVPLDEVLSGTRSTDRQTQKVSRRPIPPSARPSALTGTTIVRMFTDFHGSFTP
jgi:hypothetical protein